MLLRKKRVYWILGLVAIAVVAIVGASVVVASKGSQVTPGEIDDGAHLLGQASITLEEAISAAQASAEGALGEVDLEMYQGRLVFNVDVGTADVKVDAANGSVLGQEFDDANDQEDDDDVDDED